MKNRQGDSWLRSTGLILAVCGSLLITTSPSAEARITSATNCTTTPYGGASFGSVGTYEQLACTANLAYLFRLRTTKNVSRALQRAMAQSDWSDAGQGWQAFTKPTGALTTSSPRRAFS